MFSRWGPYVNHIGLIIIFIASIFRMSPFLYMEDYVWTREGEQKVIPGTSGEYYIENKEYIIEKYDENDEWFKDAVGGMGGRAEKNCTANVDGYKNSHRA